MYFLHKNLNTLNLDSCSCQTRATTRLYMWYPTAWYRVYQKELYRVSKIPKIYKMIIVLNLNTWIIKLDMFHTFVNFIEISLFVLAWRDLIESRWNKCFQFVFFYCLSLSRIVPTWCGSPFMTAFMAYISFIGLSHCCSNFATNCY